VWPVEVRREVSPRVVAKWTKSLELCGRLALALYHEEARRKQQMILFEARHKLPVGRVLLSSIEAMVETGAKGEEIGAPFIQFLRGHQPSSGLVLPPLSAERLTV
jgi:hypothetical protein